MVWQDASQRSDSSASMTRNMFVLCLVYAPRAHTVLVLARAHSLHIQRVGQAVGTPRKKREAHIGADGRQVVDGGVRLPVPFLVAGLLTPLRPAPRPKIKALHQGAT